MHSLPVDQALAAARRGPLAAPATTGRPAALVIGGGGALGAAVLEQLLGEGVFAPVRVLTHRPFDSALRGLQLQPSPDFDTAAALPAPGAPASHALIVFDGAPRARAREAPLVRPAPALLPVLARWLFACGVRHLLVVTPHDTAHLPQALRAGLANLDEQAVAALDFDHVLFVRPAAEPSRMRDGSLLQRLADSLLAQGRLMLPQPLRSVRTRKVAQLVARLVARLAARLADGPRGTRIAPPELVWAAAQNVAMDGLVRRWLAGEPLPELYASRERM